MQVIEAFPDITVQYVDAFPGLPGGDDDQDDYVTPDEDDDNDQTEEDIGSTACGC